MCDAASIPQQKTGVDSVPVGCLLRHLSCQVNGLAASFVVLEGVVFLRSASGGDQMQYPVVAPVAQGNLIHTLGFCLALTVSHEIQRADGAESNVQGSR